MTARIRSSASMAISHPDAPYKKWPNQKYCEVCGQAWHALPWREVNGRWRHAPRPGEDTPTCVEAVGGRLKLLEARLERVEMTQNELVARQAVPLDVGERLS